MADSMRTQINNIKQDVRKECKKITKKCAKQASEDLCEAHMTIIDFYYASYAPEQYARTFNLYNSLINKGVMSVSNGHKASVTAASVVMNDNYNISPDVVFNLVWNKGHRGLPTQNLGVWHPVAIYRGFYFGGSTPHEAMTNAVNGWGETMQGLL